MENFKMVLRNLPKGFTLHSFYNDIPVDIDYYIDDKGECRRKKTYLTYSSVFAQHYAIVRTKLKGHDIYMHFRIWDNHRISLHYAYNSATGKKVRRDAAWNLEYKIIEHIEKLMQYFSDIEEYNKSKNS